MVTVCKLILFDIGGIAYLIQAGHINKYISEPTNIYIHIIEHSNKRFRVNGFNNIEPVRKNDPGPAYKLVPRTLSILKGR